ncbi:hypothetical protein AAG906_009945 [Vitis piasezkii]
MCFMAINDLNEGSKKDKWFLDSGCSRHMTGDESKFAFLTKRNGGYVTFGDNSKGRIIGQGNIGNDTSSLIESILLVDGLKHNLLSISQLCDKCFKVIFETSHCIIKDIQNDKTIFMGHRCDNVYAINISKYDGHDRCFSSMHDQSWLWHRRLGHANMDLISQLNKDELVRGLPKINFQKHKVCERRAPPGLRANALLSHLSLSRQRLVERRVVMIFEPIFSTLVQAFYSRATYGLRGPVLSIVRGVEIRLSLESIYCILDIPSIELRVYEAKAWPTMPGFEPREAVQRLCKLADA